jgi:hypothetical protein
VFRVDPDLMLNYMRARINQARYAVLALIYRGDFDNCARCGIPLDNLLDWIGSRDERGREVAICKACQTPEERAGTWTHPDWEMAMIRCTRCGADNYTFVRSAGSE